MKTAITASLHADHPETDLTDLVFEHRNREYGAFTLRKSYSKFLTTAAVFASILFILGLSSPLILSYLKGVVAADPGIAIDTKKIIDINIFKTEQPPDKLAATPPDKVLTNTQQFHAPTIVPDNAANEIYTPPLLDDKTQLGRRHTAVN
jgi:protein TonB